MTIKKLLLLLLVSVCSLTSCKPGSNENNTPDTPATIKLKSQSVAENEVLTAGEQTIQLVFDKMVKLQNGAKITLNDSMLIPQVEAMNVSFVVELAFETQYTLTVPAGAFVSVKDTAVKSEAVTIHFSTSEKPAQMPFQLGLGWNLGNQFESHINGVAGETAWGNPACTQATMDGVKAAGFTWVRIPVTWMGHIGEAPAYTIEEAWINRVAEVVEYAHQAGLKAVINIHHDGADSKYWLNIIAARSNEEKANEIQQELVALWTQIATRFADAEDWLMFEVMNEIQDGSWGTGKPNEYKVMNAWNQACVDAIRATGGNNATRWIGCPAYNTNLTAAMNGWEKPNDPANRVALAVHTYDPYNFTLECSQNTWGTDAEKNHISNYMKSINDNFLNKGIPVYIGEMGCCKRENADDEQYRCNYLNYFAKAAKQYGISFALWDNGSWGPSGKGGKESNLFINHATGQYPEPAAQTAVEALVSGYK